MRSSRNHSASRRRAGSALRAASGFGIELLEYLSPRDGRPFPPDEHANDLVHRSTELFVADADTVARDLYKLRVPFVSSGVVTQQGNAKAFQVRDPDGHVLEIKTIQ